MPGMKNARRSEAGVIQRAIRSPEITATVEAEAMPAGTLRAILRDKIEALLPQDALAIARVSEDSERRHIERVAEMLGDAS